MHVQYLKAWRGTQSIFTRYHRLSCLQYRALCIHVHCCCECFQMTGLFVCRRAVQEYTCPSCSRMYTTLHAAVLIKADGLFHCEECDSVLESGSAEGQGDALSRRERTKLVKAKQVRI